MKLSAIVMTVAALGLSAFGSTSAFAQTIAAVAAAPAPVQVSNLQYTDGNYGSENDGMPDSTTAPGLMLTFKNVTSRPIHAVTFAVLDSSGYELATVSRHGTFSPGVNITRYFGDIRLKDKHGVPARAVPVEVGFKDGSVWSSTK
jgi:hypothetical protein